MGCRRCDWRQQEANSSKSVVVLAIVIEHTWNPSGRPGPPEEPMPNPGEEEESGMPPMMPGDEGSGKGTDSFYSV